MAWRTLEAHARGATRHGGDEPFAFVMPAQEAVELRLVAGLANRQQQMTLPGFGLHDANFQRVAQVRRHAELEELTVAILLDVHGVVSGASPAGPVEPFRSDFTHLQARAHRGELGLDFFSIHKS